MAFSPNMPTSFVPRTAETSRRFRADFAGTLGVFAYGVFGIVFVLALGIFLYARVLASEQAAKDAALSEARAAIDPAVAEGFVRLRDRLISGKTLLANHLALSGFFSLFETVVPTTVRFSTIHLSIDGTGTVVLEGAGDAKNFNALAAASMALAQDGGIKNAIFSHIVVSPKNGSVSFALAATLDPKVVAFDPQSRAAVLAPAAPAAPVVTSTP